MKNNKSMLDKTKEQSKNELSFEPIDEMSAEDMRERKKVLWNIINELDPHFFSRLIAYREFYNKHFDKGEIQILIGKKIRIVYLTLNKLEKMASVSDAGLKFSLEYSIRNIHENDKNKIVFVVWDVDDRTYFYEYNINDNTIAF